MIRYIFKIRIYTIMCNYTSYEKQIIKISWHKILFHVVICITVETQIGKLSIFDEYWNALFCEEKNFMVNVRDNFSYHFQFLYHYYY